jgi:hypothetical protein
MVTKVELSMLPSRVTVADAPVSCTVPLLFLLSLSFNNVCKLTLVFAPPEVPEPE